MVIVFIVFPSVSSTLRDRKIFVLLFHGPSFTNGEQLLQERRVDPLLDRCYFQGMQTICNKFHFVKMAEKYRGVHIYLK